MVAKLASTKDIRALFHSKPEISRVQIDTLLEKHGFSRSQSITTLEGNFTNQVLMIGTLMHGDVILKTQFRKFKGLSLNTEFITTEAFQGIPEIPVSEDLIYDSDGDPLDYECLVIPRERGESGISYYLRSARKRRLELGSLLGSTVAHIHSQQCPEELLHGTVRDLTFWETTVRDAIFGDEELASSVTVVLPELSERLFPLMDSLPKVKVHGTNVLLWGEAGLHNVLVEDGNDLRICNVHDFQSAGWGTVVHDFRQAEGEYIAKHESEYFEEGYLNAFRDSYAAIIGDSPPELSSVEEKALSIVKSLRQVRFFWDCGRLLHPKTPEYLESSILDLESLQMGTGS